MSYEHSSGSSYFSNWGSSIRNLGSISTGKNNKDSSTINPIIKDWLHMSDSLGQQARLEMEQHFEMLCCTEGQDGKRYSKQKTGIEF